LHGRDSLLRACLQRLLVCQRIYPILLSFEVMVRFPLLFCSNFRLMMTFGILKLLCGILYINVLLSWTYPIKRKLFSFILLLLPILKATWDTLKGKSCTYIYILSLLCGIWYKYRANIAA
jgi:hypothetical protein